MVDSFESPLDAVARTVGEQTTDGFEILSNDTRLAILLALWEAKEPGPPFAEPSERAVSFSELRDRVGVKDSGQFNYHLDKLVGTFIEQADEGYTLTQSAERILSAVLAGTLTDPPSFEGEPIDAECFRCGGQVVVDYNETIAYRRCTSCDGVWQSPNFPSGTLVGGYRPPVSLENRTIETWNREGNKRDWYRRAMIMEGVCPDCSGTVTTTIHICEDHDAHDETICDLCGSLWAIQSQFVCDVCKFGWITPAWGPIFSETAVLAFYHDHGLDPRSLFDVAFYSAANRGIFDSIKQVAVASEEPRELAVTAELDGDRLIVTLNDEARVIEVTGADQAPG